MEEKSKNIVDIKQDRSGVSISADLGDFNITQEDIQKYSSIRCSVCDSAVANSYRTDRETDKLICDKCWNKKYKKQIQAESEYRKAYSLEKTDLSKSIEIYEQLVLNEDFKCFWAHERLRIIYNKNKQYIEALRICKLAYDRYSRYVLEKSPYAPPNADINFNDWKYEIAKLEYRLQQTEENLSILNVYKNWEQERKNKIQKQREENISRLEELGLLPPKIDKEEQKAQLQIQEDIKKLRGRNTIPLPKTKDGQPLMTTPQDAFQTAINSKGQSVLAVLNEYVVVDLETTGLSPHYDEIIEMCALKINNGNIVDKFTTFVKPSSDIPIFITEMTGITNEMVADAPSIADVLPRFIDFVGNSALICHNATFDINFIYYYTLDFIGTHFTNNFLCTMRLSRRLFKQFESHRLIALAKEFSIEAPTHRAESDCLVTYKCYEYMKNFIIQQKIDVQELMKKHQVKAKKINATVDEFDESHPLYNKICVFTGALLMYRRDAMQLVANIGGICADSVTPQTNFLILGEIDYRKVKDGKSAKHKKAEELALAGYDITILPESVFLDLLTDSLIGNDERIVIAKRLFENFNKENKN